MYQFRTQHFANVVCYFSSFPYCHFFCVFVCTPIDLQRLSPAISPTIPIATKTISTAVIIVFTSLPITIIIFTSAPVFISPVLVSPALLSAAPASATLVSNVLPTSAIDVAALTFAVQHAAARAFPPPCRFLTGHFSSYRSFEWTSSAYSRP